MLRLAEVENKELKEKYNQTSHKLMEFKSQCEILKQDLKKSQKNRIKVLENRPEYFKSFNLVIASNLKER